MIKALSDVVNFGNFIGLLPCILFVGTASVSVLRTSTLPRWASVFGLVVTVTQSLGSLSLMITSGFFAAGGPFSIVVGLGTILWVLIVSIVLTVKVGTPHKEAGISPANA